QRDARASLDVINRFLRESYQSGIVIDTPAGQGPYSHIAFTFPHTDDVSIVSVAITMGKNVQLGRQKVLKLTIQKVRVMN
ncbi:MAG: hypothetical protein KGL74_11770, partial [Elusimicrobia bacterium]|nr:hypothetical protein [Elusimicrobiota bacterium]